MSLTEVGRGEKRAHAATMNGSKSEPAAATLEPDLHNFPSKSAIVTYLCLFVPLKIGFYFRAVINKGFI